MAYQPSQHNTCFNRESKLILRLCNWPSWLCKWMFVCSMLQSSYLLLVPHSGQFPVRLNYNQLARISVSLNSSFIQKPEGGFALGPLWENILTYWCTTFFIPCPGRYCCNASKSACRSLTCLSLAVLSAWERAVLSLRIVTYFSIFFY